MAIYIFLAVILIILVAINRWWANKMKVSEPQGVQPPTVTGSIPIVGAGLDWLKNPSVYLNEKRKEVGDIFILEAFGLKLFFVFSSEGLEKFYKVPESQASFQEATKNFLGYKVPPEIMTGTLNQILAVLKKDFSANWLKLFTDTVLEEINSMPSVGEFEVFQFMKDLMHKSGFRAWIGEAAVQKKYYGRLIKAFNQIDPEVAFTNISSLVTTILTRQSAERQAFQEFVAILQEIYDECDNTQDNVMTSLHELYAELPVKKRYIRVATDIMVLHISSQSNLYAAVSWTLINLLQHPKYLNQVVSVNNKLKDEFSENFTSNQSAVQEMVLLEQCFHESIRLAQQSLTLRLVLKPVQIGQYTVAPGYYIATLLSCLNTQEDLMSHAKEFLPDEHYLVGGKPNPASHTLGAEYAISTFGYGSHACPGKKFAISACKILISLLLDNFELKPLFTAADAKIIETQIGAVGRTVNKINVQYTKLDK